jgi:hypothetical protein
VNVTINASNALPAAAIDSVSPNPAHLKETVTFTGHGTGTITEYSWRSSIDGPLSSSASFSTANLSGGTHTVYFKVKDNNDNWSPEASKTIDIEEHLYACLIYSWENPKPRLLSQLQSMGAIQQSTNVWRYRNAGQNRTYKIFIVESIAAMEQALMEPGSHVLVTGHSNYGVGPSFGTAAEINAQVINNIYFIDDDRLLNLSSPWIRVSVSGMRTGRAYPFWWPEFKDGTSGIMPYDFGDPRGDPAYNYAISYQVPGDPQFYKISTVSNSEASVPDSNSALFSSTGQA